MCSSKKIGKYVSKGRKICLHLCVLGHKYHSFELDPSDIVMSKLRMNEKKYPVEKAKGSAKKYNELWFRREKYVDGAKQSSGTVPLRVVFWAIPKS